MKFRDVVEARVIICWLDRRVPCLGGHFGALVSLVGGVSCLMSLLAGGEAV